VKYDTLPLRPPATDRCSNRHLFRLTAVQSLLVHWPMCSCSKVSRSPPPRPSSGSTQSFCRVTVDASICYSYCINNITLLIRKCRQHIKTRQTCGDTSLSYGLDGRAVVHPPLPVHLVCSLPLTPRRAIVPSLPHIKRCHRC